MKVLLVDDDEEFAIGLAAFMAKYQITTVLAHRIACAEKQLRQSAFDVVLLDVMLPGGNGFEFLPTLRELTDVPVVMLTALGEESERIHGLDLGADDYVTKPFSARELVARLQAIFRRQKNEQSQTAISVDDLQLFSGQSVVAVGNLRIELTAVESRILQLLFNARNHTLPRAVLYQQVLLRDESPLDRSLDVHISNLRRKLGPHPTKGSRIRAIRGVGYVLTT